MNFTRARLGTAGVVLAAAALLVAPVSFAHAQDDLGDGLQQVIDPNQAQGTGRVVLDDGHIDYGPTLGTGEWILQIHDDTAQPTYWRMLSDVVARVNDASMLTIPDDPTYSFLGIAPGTDVWVIPQVREPGVIWAGWNTQEPTVLDSLSVGVTQRILGVDGPGVVSVYLQAGNFGDPQPLWSTHEAFPQESWIEVNKHTHAHWVFSEPGAYLVEMEFEGDLIDGTHVVARDTLGFAVGDATDAESVFDMEFDGALIAQDPEPAQGDDAGDGAGAGEVPGAVDGGGGGSGDFAGFDPCAESAVVVGDLVEDDLAGAVGVDVAAAGPPVVDVAESCEPGRFDVEVGHTASHRVRCTPVGDLSSRGLLGVDHPDRGGRSATTRQPAALRLAPDSPSWVKVMRRR